MRIITPAWLALPWIAGLVTSTLTADSDVQFYGVFKEQKFEQSDPGTPLPAGQQFRFNAIVQATAPNRVVSASVIVPSGSSLPLSQDSGGTMYQAQSKYATKAQLDSAAPSGPYLMVMGTANDGAKSISLTLPADAYPSTPRISNYSAAQAIDPGAPFTFTWDPFVGGTTSDYILFEIYDSTETLTVFSTPVPSTPGALNGVSTSITIPAGTLQAGQMYSAQLNYIKVTTTNTSSYPGVLGWTGFIITTAFNLQSAAGPDVRLAGVVKGVEMQQNDAGAPVLLPSSGYSFRAFVQPNPAGSISSAQLLLPAGQSQPLQIDGEAGLSQAFDTQSLLDSAFPDGNYTLMINTPHDGTHNVVLNLAGGAYPSAPHLANFSAAQAVDPNIDFVAQWDPLVGAGTNDFVQFMVEDAQGNDVVITGDPGTPGALNGTATSFIIPRGILSPGNTYRGRLLLAHGTIAQAATYPNVVTVAAYYREIRFPLITTGNPASQNPQLLQPGFRPDGAFTFQVAGQAQTPYRIDVSNDLVQWDTLMATNSSAASFWVVDSQAAGNRHRFYRVVREDQGQSPMFILFFTGTIGSFGNNPTPSVSFPVQVGCYRVVTSFSDVNPAPASQVLFTGPNGTGEFNTPAEQQWSGDSSTSYSTTCIGAGVNPAGAWTVSYKGSPSHFTIVDPQSQTHLVIPVPTLTINNGSLTSMQWIYKNAVTGATLAVPQFITGVQVQINDAANNRIYESPQLASTSTSHTLTQPINVQNISSLNLGYADSLGNSYIITFGR